MGWVESTILGAVAGGIVAGVTALCKTSNAKTAGGVGGAVGALVVYLAAIGVIGLPFRTDSVERQIEAFASSTNERLPMQVDEFTRWERVETGPGKAYAYVYTVSKDLSDEEKQSLRDDVSRRALAASDMQATFQAGVTVWYKYLDTSGEKILEFPVRK